MIIFEIGYILLKSILIFTGLKHSEQYRGFVFP